MREFGAKGYFVSVIAIILTADIAILLNIPLLRQMLGFLCFTIIPGLLLLHILKLDSIGFLKKFLYSVGLSLSFLIFVGLAANFLLPYVGISKPLSAFPLVVSFSIVLAILCFFAYRRNKGNFYSIHIFNPVLSDENQLLISPLLFPLLLPLLSILGTHLMNTTCNNILLIIVLLLILIYLILIVRLNKKIPQITFPIAVWMISLSLLLMWGLTSNYFLGMVSIYREYESFQIVSNNLHWGLSSPPSIFTACLSTSLLPGIYQSLLGIDGLYIYKVIYQIIFSLTPLACYILFKRYLSSFHAFLASFFFVAQIPFIFIMPQFMRGEIGIFFFLLAMIVFLDNEIGPLSKKVMFIMFATSLVVSYYATPMILIAMLFPLWLLSKPIRDFSKSRKDISGGIIALLFALIFIWWSQITNTAFSWYVQTFKGTFVNLGNLFVAELREPTVQAIFGGESGPLPQTITVITHDVTFALIAIGILCLIIKKNKRFDRNYLILALTSFTLLAAAAILPFISTAYGAEKLYITSLLFLAPMFIIGAEAVSKYLFRSRFLLIFITFILICQFTCATSLVYLLFNVPFSPVLDTRGHGRDLYYTYDQEVAATYWLQRYYDQNSMINTNPQGKKRFILARYKYNEPEHLKINDRFFIKNKLLEGYIFLGYPEVTHGVVYTAGFFDEPVEMTEYSHLFISKGKIYSSGGAEVYK